VLGKSAQQFVTGAKRLMSVLDRALAFLRKIPLTIGAASTGCHHSPDDPVTHSQWLTAQISPRCLRTKFSNSTDDFVPQHCWYRHCSTTFKTMQIAPTQCAGFNLDQNLVAARSWSRD
jgi:hypothetical protein